MIQPVFSKPRVYDNGFCHGDRFIFDQDVYDSNFNQISRIEDYEAKNFAMVDEEHVFIGSSQYRITLFRWTGQRYELIRSFQAIYAAEKSIGYVNDV